MLEENLRDGLVMDWLSDYGAIIGGEDESREDNLENESESADEDIFENEDPPLYAGAPLTLHESLVSILTLVLTFNLSGTCLLAILRLVRIHCVAFGNNCKSSLYLFKKYFVFMKGGVTDRDYYCSRCFAKSKQEVGCKNAKCGTSKKPPLCCLIKMPLVPQLQAMFNRKGFYSKLQFACQRPANKPEGLSDVCDGSLYLKHVQNGMLGDKYSLSLMWYTDGAALFKSSKVSVWPVYLVINELPYSERFKKENLLVVAVWCGPVQPYGNLFVEAIYPYLEELQNGVNCNIEGEVTKIKALLLNGTGDTPARALMLNMVKHNGEHACQKCEQKGETREGCPGVRVFPYRPDEMVPRTLQSLDRHGSLARVLCGAYMGLKGKVALAKVTGNPIQGTSIDAMHLIYSGIGKTHLKFFLDPSYNLKSYVGKLGRGVLDSRLLSIKPPHYLTRVPKSIEDIGVWKTSEWKSMFLYYAPVVLVGLAPGYHLEHFASLVAAVQYLNSDNVTDTCLSKAEALITKYVSFFEDFYGREYMTLTVHLLLHLVELTKAQGPLFTTACFGLEGVNGEILNLVHGTRHAEMQISSSLEMCLGLSDLVGNLKEGESKKFCQDLLSKPPAYKQTRVGDFTIVGSWSKLETIPEHLKENVTNILSNSDNLYQFSCLRSKGYLFVSLSHPRPSARDSRCANFSYEGSLQVGIIKFFLRVAKCDCLDCTCDCNLYAVIERVDSVEPFKTLVPDVYVPNIHRYRASNCHLTVPVSTLLSVNVKMFVSNRLYVAKRCNGKEIE